LDKQIQDFKVELNNNLDNGLVVLEGRLKQLSSESAEKLAKIYGLPQVESDFNRLNKIKDSKDKFYLNLIDQRANYMIANAGVVSDYVILQNATTSKLAYFTQSNNDSISRYIIGYSFRIVVGYYSLFIA
jgi:hypothetical protein